MSKEVLNVRVVDGVEPPVLHEDIEEAGIGTIREYKVPKKKTKRKVTKAEDKARTVATLAPDGSGVKTVQEKYKPTTVDPTKQPYSVEDDFDVTKVERGSAFYDSKRK